MQVTLNIDLLHVKKKSNSSTCIFLVAFELLKNAGPISFLKDRVCRSIMTFSKEPDIIHHFQLLKIREFGMR